MHAVLKRKIEECFDARTRQEIGKEHPELLYLGRSSLLVETWIKFLTDYSVIDGALSVFEWIEFGKLWNQLFAPDY